jgi:uncharacterized protein (UPF0276 family)
MTKQKMNIPELGVGIIYFPGFENVLDSNPDLIQVIEIEPQTFWYRYKSGLDSFVYDKEKINYLQGLNKPMVFHGVGYPIGGTIQPDANHLACLKKMMDELHPIWMSEHLSFNTVIVNDISYNTNFLLPPLQTTTAIETIASSIQSYARHFEIPFAFETGTNYLSPKKFELDDGDFVNQVAQQSEAHILFDVHNILANQKNGRQAFFDYFKQISHEKIIQLHLAGGFYFKNYYLDAHSNVSSDEVLTVFEKVVEQLPNLKAITFEMLPEYLNFVSEKAITMQLEKMNAIWEKRGRKLRNHQQKHNIQPKTEIPPTMKEWEESLGLLAIGRDLKNKTPLILELENDPGIGIIKDLVEKFKGSLVVSSLKLSCRYIMLYYGVEELNKQLRTFWYTSVPKLFASDNGIDFANYLLHSRELKGNDLLMDLISYEKQSLLTLLDQIQRNVDMSFNPTELIPFLAEYKLPESLTRGHYIITILPEENYTENIHTVLHT